MKLEIMQLEQLPVHTGRVIQVFGHEIALFRLGNGKIRAVENRCPHKGGPLAEGIVSGDYVFCPLHDWKICLADGNVQSPDTGCVKTFQTEIEENRIYIMIEPQEQGERRESLVPEQGLVNQK
ncbi:nitrite reductase small subunit NirD [Fodinisporobacter ferrooxydans]|uniref:Nitrite reductase small subunit NirD n=1 Tax=Fodinisporobacter ferrooxydans TaxID=2901836 RepID=A0ABY4CQ70_9BACL|nr:nitrite reductase small subunit NirD [Alicyclobacillaceae bacterium MYW30-H2]